MYSLFAEIGIIIIIMLRPSHASSFHEEEVILGASRDCGCGTRESVVPLSVGRLQVLQVLFKGG